MPKEIETKALKELGKLEQMPPMSAEGTVVRNYLDWLIDVPWKKKSKDSLDTLEAKKILDEDHHGLEDVKERILDYLAVKKLSKSGRGPILCLVGPPGVGKTSLGKSVARALGRKFVRLSLGGVRDEAEIRGHRRTYIGAMPGRIIQSMKKAETVNPVMMLDEIDKMSMDFRGDPSSALLEVLDPEQNKNFSDHYMEVDYDLSSVLFMTTANLLDNIPGPLLDRMEVLQIAGYTEDEKLQIAKDFLYKKKLEEHGLTPEQLTLGDSAIRKIIRNYTREAGVRNLEREIATVCRKVSRKVVEKKKYNASPTAAELSKYLGPEKFRIEKAEIHNDPGHAMGMAWTSVGGEIMNIEVSIVPGKGKLLLTGKLGDVMKESAQAALTYIRSRAELFQLPDDFYLNSDIHIHVPEGAIPKDGPSAGITMVSAMVSALCKIPVRHDVSMTGEVTLRGKVLPIGGLKEKVLAAHRAGIKEIVYPKENRKDLEKIPDKVLKAIKFTALDSMDDVLKAVMTESVFHGKKGAPKGTPKDVPAKKKPESPDVGRRAEIN
jgi:ATP-dependent Lon protease